MRSLMFIASLGLTLSSIDPLFSAAPPAAKPTQEGAWLKGHFINKKSNYEIDYPTMWERKEAPPLDIILFAPIKPGALHPNATMNMISENIGSGLSMDQIYAESIKNLSNELKEVHIEGSGERPLNGTPSKWVRYTHMMQGTKYTVTQYFILNQDTIYLMTFSSPSSMYAEFRDNFENIASSFRLLTKSGEQKK